MDTLFRTTALVLVVLGPLTITTNGFVIGFYRRKWQEAVPLMYIMMAVCDSVTGVVAVCHGGIFTYSFIAEKITLKYPRIKSDLFPVVYILLQTATRTSLFYNTMLAVVRTINITRPFHHIIKRVVIVCATFYPVLLAVLLSVQGVNTFSNVNQWEYYAFMALLPGQGEVIDERVKVFLVIPLILPAIICLVCAVIQTYSILKPSIISPPSIREQRMTITIVMLTLVCLICNIPYTVLLFYWSYIGFIDTIDFEITLTLAYLLHTLLPFIQAILNPAILLTRGAALRAYVVTCVRGLFSIVQRENANELEMVVMNNGVTAQ